MNLQLGKLEKLTLVFYVLIDCISLYKEHEHGKLKIHQRVQTAGDAAIRNVRLSPRRFVFPFHSGDEIIGKPV